MFEAGLSALPEVQLACPLCLKLACPLCQKRSWLVRCVLSAVVLAMFPAEVGLFTLLNYCVTDVESKKKQELVSDA